MKKVLGSLIVTLSLIVSPFVGYNQASAATAASTYLDMNETTDTTTRINASGSMYLSVNNLGTKDM